MRKPPCGCKPILPREQRKWRQTHCSWRRALSTWEEMSRALQILGLDVDDQDPWFRQARTPVHSHPGCVRGHFPPASTGADSRIYHLLRRRQASSTSSGSLLLARCGNAGLWGATDELPRARCARSLALKVRSTGCGQLVAGGRLSPSAGVRGTRKDLYRADGENSMSGLSSSRACLP